MALHHNAEPVSFNADFEAIALVSALRLTRGFGKGRWTAGDRLSRGERGLPAAAFIMQVLALAEQKAIDVRFGDHERFVK